jgi:ribosome biogenesis SPOUT family RNA methylase Rps3
MKYIIEHMEDEMYDWCILEYHHISKVVGPENLMITNVKAGADKINGMGKILAQSVAELGLDLKRVCLLDPEAKQRLNAQDKKEFDYLLFGGILGDFPRKGRTKELAAKVNCPRRNLSDKQMSTDTAVYVAHLIMDGKKFEDIHFAEELEIVTGENESVTLPFRYVIEDGEAVLPDSFIEFIMRHEEF